MLIHISKQLGRRAVSFQHWRFSPALCAALRQRTAHLFTSTVRQLRAVPELTRVKYPDVTRGNFSSITESDVQQFRALLADPGQIITDDDELQQYNVDWLGIYRGSSQIVLRPKTTGQVSEILKYCNSRRLAVVPQGGNTGMVGGSVPVFDEVIVSTQLMNHVVHFDKIAGIVTCQAGCILESLDNEVAKEGFMMPLDLGAKGSCHIGGNISTNAGGIRLLRYGSLHANVVGIEAVMANGELIDCLSDCRKDNVGYHLPHIFIGSEGTLGFVTTVSLLCHRRPSSVNVAFLGCNSFDAVLQLLSVARGRLNEILSAFEFLDQEAMMCVTNHLHVPIPIRQSPFYVLIETQGSDSKHDEEKLQSFLETAMNSEMVVDGTVATELTKIKALWQIRELIAVGLLDDGHCYKYDVSLPLSDYYSVVEVMRTKLTGLAKRVCGYGHVGDGNLHFNVTSPKYNPELQSAIDSFLYKFISECRGSISAEHGVGFSKRKYVHYSRTMPAIQLMNSLKLVMDPNGILNPYKTLPGQSQTKI